MPLPDTREFPLEAHDFQKICGLIYNRAGITLNAQKEELVYSRLSKRLRSLNLKSFHDYLKVLEHKDNAEWELFVNALTTNLTHFFREIHHFTSLEAHLKRPLAPTTRVIWSCASSTGEEPYSIAITACEIFNTLKPPVKIIGTDIDTEVIRKAKLGVYNEEQMRGITQEQRSRYFERANNGTWNIHSAIKELVDFRPLNLMDTQWSLRAPLDAIFCRNVMIYFDKAVQQKIIERFHPLMAKDALLYIGHSENIGTLTNSSKLIGRTVYSVMHGRS